MTLKTFLTFHFMKCVFKTVFFLLVLFLSEDGVGYKRLSFHDFGIYLKFSGHLKVRADYSFP